MPDNGKPSAIHYTRAGSWFDNWKDVYYGDLWRKEEADYNASY